MGDGRTTIGRVSTRETSNGPSCQAHLAPTATPDGNNLRNEANSLRYNSTLSCPYVRTSGDRLQTDSCQATTYFAEQNRGASSLATSTGGQLRRHFLSRRNQSKGCYWCLAVLHRRNGHRQNLPLQQKNAPTRANTSHRSPAPALRARSRPFQLALRRGPRICSSPRRVQN